LEETGEIAAAETAWLPGDRVLVAAIPNSRPDLADRENLEITRKF